MGDLRDFGDLRDLGDMGDMGDLGCLGDLGCWTSPCNHPWWLPLGVLKPAPRLRHPHNQLSKQTIVPTKQANRLRHPHKLAANGPVQYPLAAPLRGDETSAPPETSSKSDVC